MAEHLQSLYNLFVFLFIVVHLFKYLSFFISYTNGYPILINAGTVYSLISYFE